MRNKITIGIIIFLIILFGYCITSNATISSQSKQVNSGEEFSITVSSDIPLGAYNVKVDSYSGLTFVTSSGGTGAGGTSISNALTSGGTTTLATFTFRAPSVTSDTQYSISISATGMGDENLSSVPNSNCTATITVKAPNTGTTTPDTPSTPTKSSEARLNNLGFNPNDFKGFRSYKTEYDVVVPNNVSSVKVYAEPKDSSATITGTGTVNLKEGLNTVKVTVTAEDGVTKKTYTMNITRLTAEEDNPEDESEARLKNLGIRPTEYDFSGFKRDTTKYTVEVPNELTEVEVYAEAVNSDAKITGTGKVTLQEGENTVNVEVTAPDGTTKKTYTLVITRTASTATEEPEEPTDNEEKVFGLSQLLVKGQSISPKFSENVYEYTIGLTEDLSSLDIEATASDDNATVEIVGNENLQNGENIITILVSNAETGKNATYQIIVNKNVQDATVVAKVDWLKTSTWGTREKIIVGVAIALVMIIIVAIVIKVRLARRDDDDMDLPGGEELDRALLEHQEIEDEVSEAEEDASEIEENVKSDAEIAQEYFESYSKRRGKHF